MFIKAPKKFYFHYPFPVAIVVVKGEDKVNLMSVVWHTQLSFDPPLYGVSISPKRYTFGVLRETKQFTVNFVDFEFMEIVAFVGGTSGRDIDKAATFDIPLKDGIVVDVPVLEEAYAAYECELKEERTFGDHTLFVGEIVGVHYNEDLFEGELFVPRIEEIKPVLYAGKDIYLTTDPETKRVYGKEDVKRFLEEWGG